MKKRGRRVSDEDLVGLGGPKDNGVVAFDYIKSNDFRTVWADGVIGGVTPAGLVHFAAYSERPAIPRRQVFGIGDAPTEGVGLGAEIAEKRVSRDAFVREMAVDIMMSPAVAESVGNWLLEQAQILKNFRDVQK
jgi:hypothetical protein